MSDLKNLGLAQEPTWIIAAPGVLVLPGTKYEIRYETHPILGTWIVAFHDASRLFGDAALASVKYGVKKHMQQLLEFGLEP